MKKLKSTARGRHRLAQKSSELKVLLALVLLFIANLMATPNAQATSQEHRTFSSGGLMAVQSLIL